MLSALFVAGAMLAQAQPFPAGPPEAAPPPAPAAAAQSGKTVSPLVIAPDTTDKPAPSLKKYVLVCRDEAVLGTLFPKKVCATQAQFAERQREDQKEVREWQALRPYKDPSSSK
ncbi:hypothetical protein [Phenylobacterium sp.]|uniref:hypothetical protein n=1 Tax=Phenylobacterium sp. TaxID=1871053 RepID=UPI00120BD028|nr:hypothetical protein [Phenylobacterium sp.]THD65049.1 MAG: hypothetical protein E8A49_00630 [Phenylobacterium sp.]